MVGVKDFNEKYYYLLELMEKGKIDRALEEYPKLVEIYNEIKRNDLYFKLKKVHKSLSNYSLIKKAYELK